jgi:hypothetical protein
VNARLPSPGDEASSIVPATRACTISTPGARTASAASRAAATGVPSRLANPLPIERSWTPDREAMVAALRVMLDLPRQLPDRGQGGAR